MGQGCQVTGSAQGAFFRNVGMYTLIDHGHQSFQGGQPNAGVAFYQSVGTNGHGSPDHFPAQGFAVTTGVGTDQVFLQLGAFILRNMHPAQRAEARGNPVNNAIAVDDIINQGTGSLDFCNSVRIKGKLCPIAADCNQLFQGQIITGQYDFFNGFNVF